MAVQLTSVLHASVRRHSEESDKVVAVFTNALHLTVSDDSIMLSPGACLLLLLLLLLTWAVDRTTSEVGYDCNSSQLNRVNNNERPKAFGEGCTEWPHAHGPRRTLHARRQFKPRDTANIGKNGQHLVHLMQPNTN